MIDEDSLHDKVVLVTGASSGIGRATAIGFARRGAAVALAARREERLRDIRATIEQDGEGDALVLQTDVSDENDVERMIESTLEEYGQLDIVVVNAGVVRDGPVDSMATEKYRTVMGVNVDGAFFTARAVVPYLRETDGNLIFVGSFSGKHPLPSAPVYAASKWWLRGFAFSLAGDLGLDDVAVSIINPSGVRTEIGSTDRQASNRERFAPGEAAEPEDVARAILYTATQDPPNTVQELDLYLRDKYQMF